MDKALYRAAMWYAKSGGSIVMVKLVEKLLWLIERLKETRGLRIFKFKGGFEKAVDMLDKGEENIHIASPAALSKIQQSI